MEEGEQGSKDQEVEQTSDKVKEASRLSYEDRFVEQHEEIVLSCCDGYTRDLCLTLQTAQGLRSIFHSYTSEGVTGWGIETFGCETYVAVYRKIVPG